MIAAESRIPLLAAIRGGGDLASGVGLRLWRAGLRVLVMELPQPLVVRRRVSFADAVYQGSCHVEELEARHVENLAEAFPLIEQGIIPVLVDPLASCLSVLRKQPAAPLVLVDARMTKQTPEHAMQAADLVIGLGPGFLAGEHCHAVIETNRGHQMGRVLWHGAAEQDTGIPERVLDRRLERVLRAPANGKLVTCVEIGKSLAPGEKIAEVNGVAVLAPFQGVLRGLLHAGIEVKQGMKLADLDPRSDPKNCFLVSDKALAVGGAVLEAILSRPELRPYLWEAHAS